MPVIKNECEKGFVMVPNDLAQLAQQGKISYEAVGVLLDMISRPTDWTFHKDFYKTNHAGIRVINRAFKELKEAGYLKIEYVRKNNKIEDKTWCVSNKPIYKAEQKIEQNVNDTKRYVNESLPIRNEQLQIKNNTNIEESTKKEKTLTTLSPIDVITLYNEILNGDLPKAQGMTETRKNIIKARISDRFKTIEEWKVYFEKVKATKFLMGNNDRSWKASFDWLINPTNILKVIEGVYDWANNTQSLTKQKESYAPKTPFDIYGCPADWGT